MSSCPYWERRCPGPDSSVRSRSWHSWSKEISEDNNTIQLLLSSKSEDFRLNCYQWQSLRTATQSGSLRHSSSGEVDLTNLMASESVSRRLNSPAKLWGGSSDMTGVRVMSPDVLPARSIENPLPWPNIPLDVNQKMKKIYLHFSVQENWTLVTIWLKNFLKVVKVESNNQDLKYPSFHQLRGL